MGEKLAQVSFGKMCDWVRANRRSVAVLSLLLVAGLMRHSEAGPLYSPRAFRGTTPNFATMSDLDNDGHLDLLICNGGSFATGSTASVVVAFGNGDTEFFPPGFDPVPFSSWTLFLDGRPNHAAIADLNHDGRKDLAIAIGFGEVEIFLGASGRSFQFRGRFRTRFGTNSVAVGDLNLDGNLDLVTANFNDNSVSVLLGDGNGGFTTLAPRAVGVFPDKAVIADFNKDGQPDVAVSNCGSNSVSVLLGNGVGGFLSRTDLPTSGGPNWVASADLNEDGNLDLVTAAFDGFVTNAVSVLLGNGDSTFQAHREVYTSSVGGAFGLAVEDLNRDGHADVVFTTDGSGTAVVLLGDGLGNFADPIAHGTGQQPLSVAVGDVNGDGNADLAVANTISQTVTVSLGNGDGAFGSRMYTTGLRPQSVAIGDFNGDGHGDLATANLTSNSLSVLIGSGDGTYGPASDLATGLAPASVATGDFNLDGFPDLAAANDSSNTVSVLLSNGDGTFRPRVDLIPGMGPVSVAAGDINGDSKPDLAVANSGSVNVSVFLGKGDGTFKGKSNFGTDMGPRSVEIGDVNSDGKPDLVVANYDGQTISVLLGTGNGGFKARKNIRTSTDFFELRPRSVSIADWSGDGRPDLAVAADLPPTSGASFVELFQQNADGSFSGPTMLGGDGVARSVDIADLDGDGLQDLAVVREDLGGVIVFRNLGGFFDSGTAFGTGNSPRGLALGDLNGDGRLDLAVANTRTPGASVMLNRGTGVIPLATTTQAAARATPASPGKVLVSPNPLNPAGVLSFATSKTGLVSVRLFDIQGRLVRAPLDHVSLASGNHRLVIDGKGQDGGRLASGIYLYEIETPDGRSRGRFAVLK